MKSFDVVISTNSGCEPYLVEELSQLGYKAKKLKPAKAIVERCTVEDVILFNIALRQAHRVYILLSHHLINTLEDIKKMAESIELKDIISPNQTFAVRGKREGKHNFTSLDIAREVGAGIIDNFMKHHNARLRVNLDNPDVEIHAELSENDALLLLNTTGESLHNRYFRPFQHFAPLKPTIASTLIHISSFSKDVHLLDPMAGGGTILMEAWSKAKGLLPTSFKKRNYLFQKSSLFSPCNLEKVRKKAKSILGAKTWEPHIIGADISKKNVAGMNLNIKTNGMTNIVVMRGDARNLDYISKGEIDLIITNPPYGLRIASKRVIQKLYYAFAKACKYKDVDEVIVLTAEGTIMEDALKQVGYEIKLRKPILYGKLWTDILKANLS
jgi:23S rRNA G2445 N2-methylase RlmL